MKVWLMILLVIIDGIQEIKVMLINDFEVEEFDATHDDVR